MKIRSLCLLCAMCTSLMAADTPTPAVVKEKESVLIKQPAAEAAPVPKGVKVVIENATLPALLKWQSVDKPGGGEIAGANGVIPSGRIRLEYQPAEIFAYDVPAEYSTATQTTDICTDAVLLDLNEGDALTVKVQRPIASRGGAIASVRDQLICVYLTSTSIDVDFDRMQQKQNDGEFPNSLFLLAKEGTEKVAKDIAPHMGSTRIYRGTHVQVFSLRVPQDASDDEWAAGIKRALDLAIRKSSYSAEKTVCERFPSALTLMDCAKQPVTVLKPN